MVIALFLLTITLPVSVHNFLHLPPVIVIMTGLSLIKFFGYHLRHRERHELNEEDQSTLGPEAEESAFKVTKGDSRFDIFGLVARAEWDTLMFFYGVILCVGGLGTLGYLSLGPEMMYGQLGPTWANILVGLLSAVVDNIPVMFAVLSMEPDMGLEQWLLVTLTAGVGGSLLSIGSAAGVALMGQAKGIYTFFAHLRWSWAIALGYAASIWLHLLINSPNPG